MTNMSTIATTPLAGAASASRGTEGLVAPIRTKRSPPSRPSSFWLMYEAAREGITAARIYEELIRQGVPSPIAAARAVGNDFHPV